LNTVWTFFVTGYRSDLRSLLRFRQFSLINLIGLTLGFSAIMALAVMLYQFLTTNGQFAHRDRMYYVKLHTTGSGDFMTTPFPFLDAILRSCPDVEAIWR
jgi:putative ABC transport system permease protein